MENQKGNLTTYHEAPYKETSEAYSCHRSNLENKSQVILKDKVENKAIHDKHGRADQSSMFQF